MPFKFRVFPFGKSDDHRATPRVRAQLVERARERVRQRFYDRADVTRALIDALLNDLALR
jgi:hypothetical protein